MRLPDSLVKDALEVSLRESRALEVLVSLNFLGTNEGLLVRHGLHALLSQGVESGAVLAEIEFGADEDDGNVGSVMLDFGAPLELGQCLAGEGYDCAIRRGTYLGANVVKGRRADDGEADEEDVGLGIGQRAKSLVILLTGGIPETEADGLAIHHDAGRIVVESRVCALAAAGRPEGGSARARTLSECTRPGRHWWCMR